MPRKLTKVPRPSFPRRGAGSGNETRLQTSKIFTGNVRCKNDDRLGSMHTSDSRRSVWHKNQWLHSFQRVARSLTRETGQIRV